MSTNYKPIITKTTMSMFYDYIDALDIPQIDYFAIGLQDPATQKSISLMSRPDWQQTFNENQFADHDPVRKATLQTKRNIIVFQEIDHINSLGKEIMHQRGLHQIKDGLILMQRHPKYNYMITLGTAFPQFDPYDFLKKYYDKIGFIKNDLIKIIEKDAKNFLQVIRPCGDAK